MSLKILSHNCYWFQGNPFRDDKPSTPDTQVLARLTALYRAQGTAILCLQELQGRAVFENVAQAMDMQGVFAEGLAYPQYGGGIFTSLTPEPVAAAGAPVTDIERMCAFSRIIANGHTLGIGNAHLTSGRQSGKEKAPAARLAELERIFQHHGPRIDILCGDFNERAGDGVSHFMEERGFADAARLFNKDTVSTTLGSDRRGDQIWVRGKWSGRVTAYGVMRDEIRVGDVAGKDSLSDHFPVWIELEV